MKEWKSIKDIISNYQQKGSARKGFLLNFIKEKIREKFISKESFDVDFHHKKLEIRLENSLLCQELFLKKEEVKKGINNALKEEGLSEYLIREIIIRKNN